jgi:hypothetical protein
LSSENLKKKKMLHLKDILFGVVFLVHTYMTGGADVFVAVQVTLDQLNYPKTHGRKKKEISSFFFYISSKFYHDRMT